MFVKKSILNMSQLLSGNIAVKALGVVAVAFYTRHLTKEHLALLPVYDMIGGLAPVVFGWGILPSLVKNVPSLWQDEPDSARAIILTGACILIPGFCLYSLLVYCFSADIASLIMSDPSYADLLQIMSVGFFAFGIRKLADQMLWCASRFEKIAYVNVVQGITNAILTIGLMLLLGVKGLVLGLVVREVICALLALLFSRDMIITRTPRMYPIRRLIKESFPFCMEGYLVYLRWSGDNWFVSALLGPSSLAIYFIATKLSSLLFMVLASADKIWTVGLASRASDMKYFKEYLTTLLGTITQIIFPFIAFTIGLTPTFIFMVAGNLYSESIIPCIILCLCTLLRFVMGPLERTIFVLRPPKTRFFLTLIESSCLVIALLLLTPIAKGIGVACSRFISSFLVGFVIYRMLRSFFGFGILRHHLMTAFVPSFLVAGFLLECQALYFNLYLLPLYIIGAFFVFLVFTSICNSDEFYSTLDSVLPFRVADPLKTVTRYKVRSSYRQD
jgi:O-antigen/teichoic acid export membrane protein